MTTNQNIIEIINVIKRFLLRFDHNLNMFNRIFLLRKTLSVNNFGNWETKQLGIQ